MELKIFHNESDFIQNAINFIKSVIEQRYSRVCKIALSGGTTPKPVYEALAKSDINFSNVEFYQVDERYVPRGDDNSNYNLINQTLISPLQNKLKGFHFFNTDLPIKECIKQYTDEIKDINFDLVILGMGQDGHTASIFPGDKESIDSTKPVLHTTTERFAVKDRLTISLKKIQDSKNILLLLKGKEKEEILSSLINDNVSIYELPTKAILEHENFSIFFYK